MKKIINGVLALALLIVGAAGVAHAADPSGVDDVVCWGAPDACIGRDGQLRLGTPMEEVVGAQTAIEISTPISVSAAYITVVSSGGIVIIEALPSVDTTYPVSGRAIASGTKITLRGTSDTDTVTLQDDDTLAGSKVELGASSRVLGLNDVLVLMFDATADRWLEVSYSDLN